MNQTEMKDLAEQVWQRSAEAVDQTETASRYMQERREELVRLYHHGIGNEDPDVKGTRWAAYNAVTEQIDHFPGLVVQKKNSTLDVRASSIIWGPGSDKKRKALDLLTADLN